MIGGIAGILYFLASISAAYMFGGDAEGTMVIAQILNIHVTVVFALLSRLLPLSLSANLIFQVFIGIFASFLLGSGIGWVFQLYRSKN